MTREPKANELDNETKLLIAQMQAFANEETSEDVEYSPEAKANWMSKSENLTRDYSLTERDWNLIRIKPV